MVRRAGRSGPWMFAYVAAFGCAGTGGASDAAEVEAGRDDIPGGAVDTATSGEGADSAGAGEPGPNGCRDRDTAAATARCLRPNRPAEYYIAQGLAYFDTLDVDAPRGSVPEYADLVARWEWPPWLLLTGWQRDNLIDTAATLRQVDPSTVPVRDCRYFDEQPFARCFVVFTYAEGPCPIYEEFVFDAAGRMTFIEAWSDLPGLLPQSDADRWANAADYPRLSTRIPGLGSATGLVDLDGAAMASAAAADPQVADFARRAGDFWGTWFAELAAAPDDFFSTGCGWPE